MVIIESFLSHRHFAIELNLINHYQLFNLVNKQPLPLSAIEYARRT